MIPGTNFDAGLRAEDWLPRSRVPGGEPGFWLLALAAMAALFASDVYRLAAVSALLRWRHTSASPFSSLAHGSPASSQNVS